MKTVIFLWIFLRAKVLEFANTDFRQVRFESKAWAWGAGGLLLAALCLRLFFWRNRRTRAHSGYAMPPILFEGVWRKILRGLPKCIVAIGAAFLLAALARPVLPRTEKVQIVEAHERFDLFDVSASMSEQFRETLKLKCQLAHEAFLKFLDMRRGQKDRASLWMFSDNAFKIEDFTTDSDLYRFEAESVPCTLNSITPAYPGDQPLWISGESGTDIENALEVAVKYFADYGDPKIKRRSLLMITDADAGAYPEKGLAELKKHHIVPYIIWIRSTYNDYGSDPWFMDNRSGAINPIAQGQYIPPYSTEMSRRILDAVVRLGGKYYRVEDPNALRRAYEDIDRTERADVRIIRHVSAPSVYQRFLLVGSLFTLAGIFLGLLVEMALGEYP